MKLHCSRMLGIALLAACSTSGTPASPPPPARQPWFDPPAGSQNDPDAVAASAIVTPLPAGSSGAATSCSALPGGRDFPVGPGQRFANIGDVPLETLRAGDTVRIAWRPEPYREKLMLSGVGTAGMPVVVCGLPGPKGELPVIDGKDATTRPQLDFPFDGHQVRGLVIVGHAHAAPWELTPSYIVVQGLEIRNASTPYSFTDRSGKKIRGCIVTENGNGLFIGTGGGMLTKDVLLEGNHVYANGSVTEYYEHNVYNEASEVTYQYNWFGSPRGGKDGPLGANIKERSAGVVIRYNWIEDGSHIIDLVDAQESKGLTIAMPTFHKTYVYGNILVRTAPSGSLIHYGGDSGRTADYRKGTLFFYNNTVVIKNARYPEYTRTPIFELSTNDEHLDSRNNVYFSTVPPDPLRAIGLLGGRDEVISGIATVAGDWFSNGWTAHDLTTGKKETIKATLSSMDAMTRGSDPGFRDRAGDDYTVVAGSAPSAPVPLLPVISTAMLPTRQYVKHRQSKPRAEEPRSIGALGE